MQDKILLGFLMQGEQTGYDIKKHMQHSTNFIFNTSAGSIYPAFQKLVKEDLVTKEERIEGGRAKNIYTITEKGKNAFLEWLNEELPIDKVKQEALLRTFFFSNLAESKQKEKLQNYIDVLKEKQQELLDLQKMLEQFDIDVFQAATLQYGIEHYGFIIDWHENFLKNLD